MPFKSKAQRRWMYATHPEMAKKWEKHTPKKKKLPEKVNENISEFISKLDEALGVTENAQCTRKPTLGATKSPTFGATKGTLGDEVKENNLITKTNNKRKHKK